MASVHAITARLNPLKRQQALSQPHAEGPHAAGSGGAPALTGPTAGGGAASMQQQPPPSSSSMMSMSGMGGMGMGAPHRAEPASGLEVMETENFRLQCFNTMTGTKFLLFTDTMQANVDAVVRRVYDLYADYVMKNPFYQLEMPVRCDAFERRLNSYIREINSAR